MTSPSLRDRRDFLKGAVAFAGVSAISRRLDSLPIDGTTRQGSTSREGGDSGDGGTRLDLSRALVVTPPTLSRREQKAVSVLTEEVEKRTGIRWQTAHGWPALSSAAIVVGSGRGLGSLSAHLPENLDVHKKGLGAEGFSLCTWNEATASRVAVLGADERGVLFGVGGLLRALRMTKGQVFVNGPLNLSTNPKYALRGHQLGYRAKTNSYDGWTVPMWDQYIRDLAVFGTNAVELIPPRSDDAPDSPHFTLPPQQMMVEMSRICDEHGLDVWIWYPALDKDYSDPKTVDFAVNEWGEVFRALPRVDAVFVPSGDPGHTPPKYMMALLEKQVENLRRYHPKGQMWMSPQSLNEEWLSELFGILRRDGPPWLSGVVYGPQIRIDLATLRKRVPDRYPIRLYPDITHSLQCQFPVPDWDVAYALTEGREVINPRPEGYANILRLQTPHSIGFISYSEGCNDDVNKIVWSALGWNPEAKVIDVLRDYSRLFLGDRYADDFAQGLLNLEKNWWGTLFSNENVETTLAQFQAMEDAASPRDLLNWRFQQGLYRAYYDAYVRRRLSYETSLVTRALDKLGEAGRVGSLPPPPGATSREGHSTNELGISALLSEAEAILDRAQRAPVTQDLRTRILELGEALFQSIRMQLSVERYQAEEVSRGANLDTLDAPITDGPWLKRRLAEIRKLPSEGDQMKAIEEVLNRTNPGPGGFYDDLGNPSRQPHLLRGVGQAQDPESRFSSHLGFGSLTRQSAEPFPIAWKRWAGSLYDAPLRVSYAGLDPSAQYRVRLVYTGDAPSVKVRLACNDDIEIHPLMGKPWPPRPLEFDIPRSATAGGQLTLTWHRELGLGGNGRGCQVAEVWLMKMADSGQDKPAG
ncbi:MAG: hypothetical protein LAO04_12655 [Acidobacteriia bacterium]|nr:hypothetical protein [Terriglobia bacterium]